MDGRIIFVGVHNKPGMEPLDVRTKSGKLIERAAQHLRDKFIILKTNLFDSDSMPETEKISEFIYDWIERVELNKNDIVVLLGGIVHKYFPKEIPIRKIKVAHPASMWSVDNMNSYIEDILTKIELLKSKGE